MVKMGCHYLEMRVGMTSHGDSMWLSSLRHPLGRANLKRLSCQLTGITAKIRDGIMVNTFACCLSTADSFGSAGSNPVLEAFCFPSSSYPLPLIFLLLSLLLPHSLSQLTLPSSSHPPQPLPSLAHTSEHGGLAVDTLFYSVYPPFPPQDETLSISPPCKAS